MPLTQPCPETPLGQQPGVTTEHSRALDRVTIDPGRADSATDAELDPRTAEGLRQALARLPANGGWSGPSGTELL